MAKNVSAQDEFVDLYDVLEVPENVDAETLRKRINTLYIEAQQNLDHRNVKKRLQFQQMYEIYLPQARHLLLDVSRRGEYDRYLQAFRTGSKVQATSEPRPPAPAGYDATMGGSGGASGKGDLLDIPELVEEAVDPEQLAADREAMWAKWKNGLEVLGEGESAPAQPLPATPASPSLASESVPSAAPATRVRPTPVVPRMNRPAPASGARPRPPQPGAIRTPGGPPATSTPAGAAQSSELEKQREQQRFQLIKEAVQTSGLIWGAGIGVVVFVIGGVILFIIDGMMGANARFGLSRTLFNLLAFAILLLGTVMGGFVARKKAKRRAVAELSALSLEELMRRTR